MEATSAKLLLATGGYDRTIKLWQADTGNCLRTLRFAYRSQVNALDQTPDKTCLAACGYQRIRLYDLESSSDEPLIAFEDIPKNITRLGFQENCNWMFTAGEDHCLRIWDMVSESPHCTKIFDCLSAVNAACLHPNQQEIAMGTQNGALFIWDIKSEAHEQLEPEVDASIQDVAISPNGQYLAAVNNKGNCYIWSLHSAPHQKLTTLQPKRKITAHTRYALRCKFSPDSRFLVTTSGDGTARIWKVDDDFSMWRELSVGKFWVWDADFSADAKYLFTGSSDGIARLWKLETKNVERSFTGHTKGITALSFKDEIIAE